MVGLLTSAESQISPAVEVAEGLDECGIDPLAGALSNIPQNTDMGEPSIATNHYLKRGLLNEEEALKIILRGGSGFGSSRDNNSPII